MRLLKAVTIYTDGSCLNHVAAGQGPGGYAALLTYKGKEMLVTGREPMTNHNVMEIMAVIAGLERLKEPCFVTIVTDSKHVQQGLGRMEGWEKNGWNYYGAKKTARKTKTRPIKDLELWQRIRALVKERGHKIKCNWVKGHRGHQFNIRVDKAARIQANIELEGGIEKYAKKREDLIV